MANVALIGASGNVGTRLLQELSARGHRVTAIARHPEKVSPLTGVNAQFGDINDATAMAELLKGHDAVVSSVGFLNSNAKDLVDLVRQSGVKRYLVVGGAGSLLLGSGERVIDQPDFPQEYRAEATAGAEFLDEIQKVSDLDWTFISPSALFIPGERTGQFRLGKDQLLVNENGSSISYEDFAIALVDELEQPAHIKQRFTVGY
ncbi:NAD(P)-dependent oxidoreductase [Agarivorans sp.]|uniref:NAD(P)-dependent oxidoreductase n=1 Tax=Agarivorans sp. TaxID=1872412 RepID=UPI003D0044C6